MFLTITPKPLGQYWPFTPQNDCLEMLVCFKVWPKFICQMVDVQRAKTLFHI